MRSSPTRLRAPALVLAALASSARGDDPGAAGEEARRLAEQYAGGARLALEELLERVASTPGLVARLEELRGPWPAEAPAGWPASLARDLARLPEAAARASADGETPPGRRALLMNAAGEALAGFGDPRGLELVLRWLEREGEPECGVAWMRAAAARLPQRDPRAYAVLEHWTGRLPLAIQNDIVRGLGETADARALDVLATFLAAQPALDAPLLTQVARVAARIDVAAPGAEERVRPFLAASDAQLRRDAAQALGRLGGPASVADLVELLGDEHEAVRAAAAWALRRISGEAFGEDAARWASWHDAERRWIAERWPLVARELESGSAAQAAAAIHEAAGHALFHGALAPALEEVLDRPEPNLVQLACRALASLGARDSLPGLVLALGHPDARVQDAAHAALCALSGRDLPPDPGAWSAALEP